MAVTIDNFPAFRLRREDGYVFPGQFSGSFCFVPIKYVHLKESGTFKIDRQLYLSESWARRNVRLNPGRTVGSHLFPEEGSKPLSSVDPGVSNFISSALRMFQG
jgi:hypothetical protein